MKFFENTGTAALPVFTERTGAANPFDGIDIGVFAAPTLVDLDGDGDPDAVIGGDDGALAYFENTATLKVVVNVAPENDAPAITSLGGAADAAVTVAENRTAVTTVTASDPDGTPSFSIVAGSDAGRFAIDASTGALSFKAAPDFESPGDADGDNVYEVVVQASDGAAVDTQTIAVTVSNEAGLDAAGSKRADTLTGSSEDDHMEGGKGKDKLSGLEAGDVLDGGKGNDALSGGEGGDSFVFGDKLKANVDKILDFEHGVDTIVLDDAVFRKLSPGPLFAEEFVVGKEAKDGSNHVIYNQKNGQLLYDLDGSGGKDAVLFAKLDKGLDLDAGDFLVI